MHRLLCRGAGCLAAALLLLQPARVAAAAREAASVAASGQVCYTIGGARYCFPLEVSFDPAGGPLRGTTDGSVSIPIPGMDLSFTSTLHSDFEGTFAGGDGGAVSGTWSSTSSVSAPDGIPFPPDFAMANGTASGTWSGVLMASGEGSGTLSGSDSNGMPVPGTWQVSYSAAEFQAGLPRLTPTAVPPTATRPAPRPTPSPNPSAATGVLPGTLPPGGLPTSLAALTAAINQERAALLYPDRSSLPPSISPWLFGQVVSVRMDADGQPYAQDIFGNRAPIGETDAELESPSAEGILSHPEFDWGAALGSLGQSAFHAVQGMASTSFEFAAGTLDALQPADAASAFLSLLTTPSEEVDTPLTSDQDLTLQTEVVIHTLQSQQEWDRADPVDNEEPEPPEEDIADLVEQQREADRYHYVELMNMVSQEEWDRLIEEGFDPAEVVRSRRSMNLALQKTRTQLSELEVAQVEQQFGLDAAATNQLKAQLLALGATPDKAEELSRATAALRVLTALSAKHTVSTGGLLSRLHGFVDSWIVRSQAQSLAIDAAATNMQGLTEAQLDLIQSADRQGLIDALTQEQSLADDPVLRLVLDHIQGGQQP